jgi:uncharacterized repeat protein (TIGR03803 family)
MLSFVAALAIALPPSVGAQGFTTVYSFPGGTQGAYPYAGLIQGVGGNLYGTTNGGGAFHRGTVFGFSKKSKTYVAYSFSKPPDGGYPFGSLFQDELGSLYGVTPEGGIAGHGTVFRVDKGGKETILHKFTGHPDGSNPYGSLIEVSGVLFGTTFNGGATAHGTIFKLDKKGAETILHNFISFVDGDGAYPYGGLTAGVDGTIYGTTVYGGIGGCFVGCGSVFKLDKKGDVTTLYSFTGGEDGIYPYAGVVPDASGNLYGTTSQGGTGGFGTVFKVDADGVETVLYNFAGGTDGSYPYAGVILDSSGNIYGTTLYGGASGYGTVFELGIL